MNDRAKTVLVFGSLLHDIGKVVYRGFSGKGTHAKLGADFISNEIMPLNSSFDTAEGRIVVNQIRYHHADDLKRATTLPCDSLAYLTYFADNISAGMDRRNEGDEDGWGCFDKDVNLRKIFNIVGGRSDDNDIAHEDYNAIRESIKHQLVQIQISSQEVNSLLNLLEATCSTVPSSTNLSELVDVSLFDHAKTTAAVASCMFDYFEDKGMRDYRSALFAGKASECYAERMFLLFSCDMSGIQDFIYNISGSGALKQLRARSLYLEMMIEHVVDELLERLGLSRANLLYSGGGHAYLLLPNTPVVKEAIAAFQAELTEWFLRNYGTDLFLASSWVECSPDDLMNKGEDKRRFSRLFESLSLKLSDAKSSRYCASDLKALNYGAGFVGDTGRECRECHRADALSENDDVCEICESLAAISKRLVEKDVFCVFSRDDSAIREDSKGLPLPFDCSMLVFSRDEYLKSRPKVRRVYTKNSWDAGVKLATHVWMGDYTALTGDEGISAYARSGASLDVGKGIQRLGVLRADVDNLGATFVSGISPDKASIS